MKLEIKDLHIAIEGKEIVKGVSFSVEKGKVVALMGPNGSGKSTLAHALMGHPKYKIMKGNIIIDGKDITSEPANIRAKAGLFLSFQYPKEIHGITLSTFLRTAVNNLTGKKIGVIDFRKLLKEKMQELNIDEALAQRATNVGFSGGEKKRIEILQLLMLNPAYAILDETDSGLDVDALQTVAEGISKTRSNRGILLITHYSRILKYLNPDEVHIMKDGKIVKSGGNELAKEIEEKGFKDFL